MIGDAAFMFILKLRDIFGIEQSGATQTLRRQQIVRQWTQFALQPFRKGTPKPFLPRRQTNGGTKPFAAFLRIYFEV